MERLAVEMEQLEQTQDLAVRMVDRSFRKKALNALLKFSKHKISFTDATSYVLFKAFVFDEIFTLDTDFKKLRLPVSFPLLKLY